MNKKIHFISGLPRSGSTLTAALLRQNPAIHAAMSTPVAGLIEGIISQVSAGSEFGPMVSKQQRHKLLTGIFDSFYGDHEKEIIFDTSRSWTAKLPLALELFPDAKFLCLVRDVSWIVDSMERQYRNNPFENTRVFGNPQQRATVYSRTEAMTDPNGLVGYAWNALREACYSEHADRLMLVDYDLLAARPEEVMKLIYDFFELPSFEHNFTDVEYDAPEFDSQLGMDGLHRVHKKVAPRTRETILPPDVFRKYDNMAFWRTLKQSKAHCVVPNNSD
jgi:sulfotransferase